MKRSSKHGRGKSGKTVPSTSQSKSLSPEEAFLKAWREGPLGSEEWQREYRFHSSRRWRFDFAIDAVLFICDEKDDFIRVAVEIEGRGRHQTVKGFRDDAEKYNYAESRGWTVFRFPATDVKMKNQWGEYLLDEFILLICEYLCGMIPDEDLT